MIHLLESPDPQNKDKQSYPRRQLSKTTTRVIGFVILGLICLFVGRKMQWGSLSNNFDTKDAAIIQYFCNQQAPESSSSNTRWEQQIKDIDRKRPSHLKPEFLPDQMIPTEIWENLPVKGAYYMIVRNEKSNDARAVIASMETHMKNGTQYPWIILNNQHFSADFRKYVKRVIKAPVFFGKIDLEAWEYPYWVDVARAEEIISDQEYGDDQRTAKLSHHQLLRYHSGLFFHHPLFKDVEYTWRVEPGADYSCNMNKDMFMVMKENNKKLGFVITMKESPLHVPTLWKRVNEFRTNYPEYVLDENATIYPWIYNEREEDYNYCHFWSNFQIADLSFFRSEAYQKYFEHLDKTGNFFYER
ncbi:glycolipid 2-alpha-mannosyltransferase-domain-containing protein [Sporodiniella umbellata]|nr:glycolipid 2-alpha-mannosyltransferase-domain-containing protein [Sporodiniella umbellata]